MRILVVIGTRPEAIKMAMPIRELRSRGKAFDVRVCLTAQHRELLDQVIKTFSISVDFDLDLMKEGQTLFDVTSDVLLGMGRVIDEARPDVVMVHGDTTTSFAAALAAYYRQTKVAHVEAGLRTGDKFRPFPEEINRRLCDALCDYHYAPTQGAKDNLLRENILPEGIVVTGNTVIDALLMVEKRPYEFDDTEIPSVLDRADRVVLVTAHRRENWGEPLRRICAAIREMPKLFPGVEVIFPVHRNPIVRDVVFPELFGRPGVTLIEPPEYVPFVHLMKRSYLILTDSGGVQEEAPSLGKPVLVLRNTTERPEGVAAGTAKLVGTETGDILRKAGRLLDDPAAYAGMAKVANPYGDGHAAERICAALCERLPELAGMRE